MTDRYQQTPLTRVITAAVVGTVAGAITVYALIQIGLRVIGLA